MQKNLKTYLSYQTKKKLLLSFLSLVLFQSCSSTKEEVGITLPDMLEDSYYKDLDSSTDSASSPFLSNFEKKSNDYSDENLNNLKETKTIDEVNLSAENQSVSSNQSLPSTIQSGNTLTTYKREDIIKSFDKKGRNEFTAKLLYDDFSYSNSSKNFDQVFRDTKASDPGVFLEVNGFQKSDRDTLSGQKWGAGFGVGYNAGYSSFSTGQLSNVKVFLWTIPVSLYYGLDFYFANRMGISLYGGPSAILLNQYRTDLGNRDKRTRLRQYGYGYSAGAEIKINLSNAYDKELISMHNNFSFTKIGMVLSVRNQYYTGFAEESIEISGLAYGLGFYFENF